MRKTMRVPVVMWLLLAMCSMIMLALFIVPQQADAEAPGITDATAADTPTDFFGWGALATAAGATAGTVLVVQLIKPPIDRWRHIPTRYVVYLIALVILTAAQHFTKGLTWPNMALNTLNAIIVAMTAMKTYELTIGRAAKNEST